jgi:hypothetical protein
MQKSKILSFLVIFSLLSLNISFQAEASRKVFYPANMENEYAILLSGGFNTINNHARYWNDIGEAYLMLKKYGYRDENIIVFYADGNYPNAINCHNWLEVKPQYNNIKIDYPATKDNIILAINSISHSRDNSLFLFCTDHGMANGDLVLWGQFLSPNEFANIFYPTLVYRIRIFEFEQCYSGAFVEPLSSKNTIVVTAATDSESSWAMPPDYEYNTFNFFFNAAIKEELPEGQTYEVPPTTADVDRDGRVSVAEAFNYVVYLTNFDIQSTPWYNDDGSGIPKVSALKIIGGGNLGDLTHLGVITILRPTTIYQATGNQNINPSNYSPLYQKRLDDLNIALNELKNIVEITQDVNQKTELINIYEKAISLKNNAEEEANKERYLQAENIINEAILLISSNN